MKKIIHLNWSEEKQPKDSLPNSTNKDGHGYDFVYVEIPLGLLYIDWKSWKTQPDYMVYLDDFYIGTMYELDEAKELAEVWLIQKIYDLQALFPHELFQ